MKFTIRNTAALPSTRTYMPFFRLVRSQETTRQVNHKDPPARDPPRRKFVMPELENRSTSSHYSPSLLLSNHRSSSCTSRTGPPPDQQFPSPRCQDGHSRIG